MKIKYSPLTDTVIRERSFHCGEFDLCVVVSASFVATLPLHHIAV